MLNVIDMAFFLMLSFIIAGFFSDNILLSLLQSLSGMGMVVLLVISGLVEYENQNKKD